jgi:hypothetical protein
MKQEATIQFTIHDKMMQKCGMSMMQINESAQSENILMFGLK